MITNSGKNLDKILSLMEIITIGRDATIDPVRYFEVHLFGFCLCDFISCKFAVMF